MWDKMEEVLIGDQLWNLKSDHKPIYLCFSWIGKKQLESKIQHVQQNLPQCRILLTPENCNTFKMMLESLFKKDKITIHSLHNHELTHLIQCALAKCKRVKIKKCETNCFRVNAWFDGECKKARRMWKESNNDNIKLKAYKQLLSKKMVGFMVSRREELIFLGKNNPKLFWKELQLKRYKLEIILQLLNGFTMQDNSMSRFPRFTLPPWSTLVLNSSRCKR